MRDNKQEWISPFPLRDAYRKRRLQKQQEKRSKGIYDKKFKYTAKEKRKVINKWLRYFPDMLLVDRKRIGRLIEPFYIGIVFLERNDCGAALKPELYAANISEPEVKTGFTVSYGQNSTPVIYDWPEDVVLEYVSFLKKRFFIQTEGAITLDDIFNFYVKMKADHLGFISLNNMKIPALIATWAGEPKKAQEYYDWAETVSSENIKKTQEKAERIVRGDFIISEDVGVKLNPEQESKLAQEYHDWAERFFRSPARWQVEYEEYFKQLREIMKQPERLRYNFIESVKALKLEKAAYQDIEGVRYKEGYFSR